MKKCLPFLFIAMMMMTMLNAQTTLALWTFDDLPGEQTPPPYKVLPSNTDFGEQTGTAFIYANGEFGSSDFINSGTNPQLNSFTGNILNDPRTTPIASKDLGIANQTSNNQSVVFKLSTTGYANLVLTFACRGTATGFNSHVWAYSTNGTTFTDLPGNNTSSRESTYALKTVDFTGFTAIDDQPVVYIRLTVDGATSGSGNNRFDNIKIDASIAGPATQVANPTFNPPGGVCTEPINVTINCSTEGAAIHYTTDGSNPDADSPAFTTPIAVSSATVIKAIAFKAGLDPSNISTATYSFPQSVNTLAELRTLAPTYNPNGSNDGQIPYTYTGEAVVTQVQAYRGVKYIQDATGAMYIYDPNGKIQNGVEVGDKVTNITGTLSNYFGMVEFIPTKECNIVSYMTNQVQTTVITASDLDDNHANPIQAKVVTLKGVMYAQAGTFATGAYYNIKENDILYDSLVYTDNYDADYIGDAILTILVDINGVCNFKGGAGIQTSNRIVPLNKSNHVINNGNAIPGINKTTIQLSPNPATNFVNIVTGSQMKLEVYGLLGNLIASENLIAGSNTISVSDYMPGMYIMKLIDVKTGQTYVQKLVVQ